MPPEYQSYDKDSKVNEEKCTCMTHLTPPAGRTSVPDKPHPYYEDSIVNLDSLGAETTARALVSPSIYTQYGLNHRDFFKV